MTQVPSQEVTVPILAQHIDAEDGHCWMTVLPELASGDTCLLYTSDAADE